VLEDHAVVAAKMGMLGDSETPAALARLWRELAGSLPLVIDPVLVSSSGAPLLAAGGLEALREELLPLATVITPNLAEAAALLGWEHPLDGSVDAAAGAASALLEFGPSCVVITGGHAEGPENASEVVDVVAFESGEITQLRGARIATEHTHGTGCLFSAGVTSALATGASLRGALDHGRACVARGLHSGREGAVWLDVVPG
jgi:hydroxymethylpyrimidine/phosphomethylpyrimidine kinase